MELVKDESPRPAVEQKLGAVGREGVLVQQHVRVDDYEDQLECRAQDKLDKRYVQHAPSRHRCAADLPYNANGPATRVHAAERGAWLWGARATARGAAIRIGGVFRGGAAQCILCKPEKILIKAR